MHSTTQEPSKKQDVESMTNLAEFSLPHDGIKPQLRHLLPSGCTTEVCSALHTIVFDFRNAHGIDVEKDPQHREDVLQQYPLSRARPEEIDAIKTISSPEEYAKLRHGGRANSPYPPLDSEGLVELCREISAALVWKSEISRARTN
jgi:hypothetical protein